MAQFDWKAWQAQQAAKKERSATKVDHPKANFINDFIKNDGDTVVVRFPYATMDDVPFESTHLVQFPGDKFRKRVRCAGDGCPLCEEKVKVDTRVFVKAIVYTVDESGTVNLVPAIWDRPAAFADIDLKNLMDEYGDLREQLFKIKRNGQGLDTRYTISVILNKTVYNPAVYKADFTCLDGIDATKVLSRPVEQYVKAVKEANGEVVDETPSERAPEDVEEIPVTPAPTVAEAPVKEAPVVAPVVEKVAPTPTPAPTTTTEAAPVRPQRYKF